MTSSEGQNDDARKTTSTGHELAGGVYLDKHFECMRSEYEAMLRSAGIQSGWRVLDAGAGGGSFLPLIDEHVGITGQIDALDLASENVQLIKQRIETGQFSSTIEPRVGSVLELPYDKDMFDLVWCANVTQYLNDDELTQMLQEMYRVTRPGGYVVIKEVDIGGCRLCAPLDPTLYWHVLEAASHLRQIAGALRTTILPRWFRSTGFDLMSYKTFPGERRQPLETADIEFLHDIFSFWGNLAIDLGLPEDELIHWRRLLDPEASDYLLKDPDFYWCEVSAVVIGQVPEH
jgi:ubiquinone/menaquinone biosynthesis C-methylase UbiE